MTAARCGVARTAAPGPGWGSPAIRPGSIASDSLQAIFRMALPFCSPRTPSIVMALRSRLNLSSWQATPTRHPPYRRRPPFRINHKSRSRKKRPRLNSSKRPTPSRSTGLVHLQNPRDTTRRATTGRPDRAGASPSRAQAAAGGGGDRAGHLAPVEGVEEAAGVGAARAQALPQAGPVPTLTSSPPLESLPPRLTPPSCTIRFQVSTGPWSAGSSSYEVCLPLLGPQGPRLRYSMVTRRPET